MIKSITAGLHTGMFVRGKDDESSVYRIDDDVVRYFCDTNDFELRATGIESSNEANMLSMIAKSLTAVHGPPK